MSNSQVRFHISPETACSGPRLVLEFILPSLFWLCFAPPPAETQPLVFFHADFRVNGKMLSSPLAGGLNSPQLSAVDLNGDGLQDLFVFDRVGDQALTFLNEGTPGQSRYVYAPAFLENFPPLRNWVLLRDYNGDGIMDIFAYSDQQFDAVMVYRGYYQSGRIAFERFPFSNSYNVIFVNFPGSGQTQLYVSSVDYPAVDDVDCDGDLDIVTFDFAGQTVELYANQSLERGFGIDSLIFVRKSDCWGGFVENGISPEIQLAPASGQCADNLMTEEVTVRHSGSTILTLDVDSDNDRDVIIGDIASSALTFLRNGGTCQSAWMNAKDDTYPSDNVPALLPVFPAAFFLDVNNDGHRDLLVAPNAQVGAEDHEALWFYENEPVNGHARFQLRRKDFLIGEMIDFGSGARPAFFDYNADGLPDLVVGNYSFYEPLGAKKARLFLFVNTGTATQPEFELIDDDFLKLNQFSGSAYGFTPAFGDLDGDGDWDAVVGEQNGRLFFALNTAGPGHEAAFAPVQYNYMDINIGQASVPQIFDLNRDGLPDLLVGERNGLINYFQNIGTRNNPLFLSDPEAFPNRSPLGMVDTRVPGYSTGYASPFFFETEGSVQLMTGTEIGRLEWYSLDPTNLDQPFVPQSEYFGTLRPGIRSHPALADLDQDGRLELVVGNFRGGLSMYRTTFAAAPATSLSDPVAGLPGFTLFPNPPAGEKVWLKADREPARGLPVAIYNPMGQQVYAGWLVRQQLAIPIEGLPAGIYFVKVGAGAAQWTGKFVRQF